MHSLSQKFDAISFYVLETAIKRIFFCACNLTLLGTPSLAQEVYADFSNSPFDSTKEVVAIYEEQIYKVHKEGESNLIRSSEVTVCCSESLLLSEIQGNFNPNNPYIKRKLFGKEFVEEAVERDPRSSEPVPTEFEIRKSNQTRVSIPELTRAPSLFGRVFTAILNPETKNVLHHGRNCISISGRYSDALTNGVVYDVQFIYDSLRQCLAQASIRSGRFEGIASFDYLSASNNIPLFSKIHYEVKIDDKSDSFGVLQLKTAYETNRSAQSLFISIPSGSIVRDYLSGELRLMRPTRDIQSIESLHREKEVSVRPLTTPETKVTAVRSRVIFICLIVTSLLFLAFLVKKRV